MFIPGNSAKTLPVRTVLGLIKTLIFMILHVDEGEECSIIAIFYGKPYNRPQSCFRCMEITVLTLGYV